MKLPEVVVGVGVAVRARVSSVSSPKALRAARCEAAAGPAASASACLEKLAAATCAAAADDIRFLRHSRGGSVDVVVGYAAASTLPSIIDAFVAQ